MAQPSEPSGPTSTPKTDLATAPGTTPGTTTSKAIARDPFGAEHLYRCPKCGEIYDSRDMAAAAKHEKPH